MDVTYYIQSHCVLSVLITWLLKLNINKCKVVSYSRKEIIDSNYYITEENTDYILESNI